MTIPAGEHFVTYKAATGYFAAAVLTAGALGWNIKGEISDVGEKVSVVREDVAVVKVKLDSLSKVTEIQGGDVEQAQYVLVQLPDGASSAHDIRVREMLIKKGLLDADLRP